MATTLRVVLNRVLTATGSPQIPSTTTTLTDSLSLKALEFLNQFKEEIEDASYWRALRQVYTVNITANTNNAPITGADERARVVRAPAPQAGQLAPLVFDVTAPNNPIQLGEIPLSELLYRAASDAVGTVQTNSSYFAVDIQNDQAVLYVYPAPNQNVTIQLHMVQPPRALVATDLDTSGLLLIPMIPLLLGTIWAILEDRGEELGANAMYTEERWRTALDSAIGRDVGESGSLDQLIPDQVPFDGTSGGGGGVGVQRPS
jgi:hypothetical protein